MTPEAKVKKQVRAILDYFGVYYFAPATGGYGRSGVPDFVGCYKGRFLGIEVKAGSNEPTALQQRELATIRKKGGVGIIVNETTLDALHDLLCNLSGDCENF
jgi:Holliday junction resolvase